MKRKFTAALLIGLMGSTAYGIPKPKHEDLVYTMRVKHVTAGQKDIPPNSVFVGPSVNKPGAYELTPGMTVAALVDKAGGLSFNKSNGLDHWTVFIFRPTKKDPDPDRGSIECRLNLNKEPDFEIANCQQKLRKGDLVYVLTPRYILP